MDPVAIDRIRANIDLANAMSSDNLTPADQQYIDVIQNFTRAQGFTSTPTPNFAQRGLLAGKESWKASLNYFDAVMQDKIGNREGYISAMTSAADKEVLAKGMRDAEGIKSFETLLDDGSAGDWLKYFAFTGLETAPHIAATFASAGAGLTVGTGLKGLRALAARNAKSLAQDKFIRNSAMYSAFAHEYAVGTGDTMGVTGDSNASLIAGVPYAVANLYANVALGAGILRQAIGTPAEKQARSYFQRVLGETARGASIEGATEAFQTEVQLLAKAATDPNFDLNSADANMMRLEAAVAGTVLGGTISGTGTAVTAPFSGSTGNFRAGAKQADQDFQEGMDSVNQGPDQPNQDGPMQGELDLEPRAPESGFIPETDEQIATQLKELIDGRGREAVQLTNQTMDPEKLAEIGLQQIELDAPEQGVLIVRADQDAAEIKAAFQSGSRDVLGNGTINKPTQMDMFDGEETQVVRSVNADGSRGADVVVTPDTEQAVTEAQKAKSDVGQTEKVTAREAAEARTTTSFNESLQQMYDQFVAGRDDVTRDNYTDEEVNAELSGKRPPLSKKQKKALARKLAEEVKKAEDYGSDFFDEMRAIGPLRELINERRDPNNLDAPITRDEIIDVIRLIDESEAQRLSGPNLGAGVDFEAQANMQEPEDLSNIRVYKAGLSILDNKPYQTMEGAEGGVENLIQRRVDAYEQTTLQPVTLEQIDTIRSAIDIVKVEGGYEIHERSSRASDDIAIDFAVKIANGTTSYRLKESNKSSRKKLDHINKLKKVFQDNFDRIKQGKKPLPLSEETKEAAKQAIALIDPNGKVLILDIKALATGGFDDVQMNSATGNLTDAQMLEVGLINTLGDLLERGYTLPEDVISQAEFQQAGRVLRSRNATSRERSDAQDIQDRYNAPMEATWEGVTSFDDDAPMVEIDNLRVPDSPQYKALKHFGLHKFTGKTFGRNGPAIGQQASIKERTYGVLSDRELDEAREFLGADSVRYKRAALLADRRGEKILTRKSSSAFSEDSDKVRDERQYETEPTGLLGYLLRQATNKNGPQKWITEGRAPTEADYTYERKVDGIKTIIFNEEAYKAAFRRHEQILELTGENDLPNRGEAYAVGQGRDMSGNVEAIQPDRFEYVKRLAEQREVTRLRDQENKIEETDPDDDMSNFQTEDDVARENDADVREAATDRRPRYTNWREIPSQNKSDTIAYAVGSTLSDTLQKVISTLRSAIKSDAKLLVIDSKALRELDGDRVHPNLKEALGDWLDPDLPNPLGQFIQSDALDYDIIVIDTDKFDAKTKSKANPNGLDPTVVEAWKAFTISHELGHQYFRNTVKALPRADREALGVIFSQDSTKDWYLNRYQDPQQAVNEWFADRVAAYNMEVIGTKTRKDGLFSTSEADQASKNRVIGVVKRIAKGLRSIYDIWFKQFKNSTKSPMHSSDLFNQWLDNTVRRQEGTVRKGPLQEEGLPRGFKRGTTAASLPARPMTTETMSFPTDQQWVTTTIRFANEAEYRRWLRENKDNTNVIVDGEKLKEPGSKNIRLQVRQLQAPDPRLKTELVPVQGELGIDQGMPTPMVNTIYRDNFDLDRFIDDYNIPRNRIQFEQTAQTAYEKGVGSMLGKLFFSAHEQLSVMGPAGRRLANMLYKKSSTSQRKGFINRSLIAYSTAVGELQSKLPNDKEQMIQILDEYGVWRENGADMNNIPPAIRSYHRFLTNFFDRMAQYAARANPDFRDRIRENYFPHMYDPEKLNDPQKQEALAQLVLAKHPDLYQDSGIEGARQSVRGLRAGLSARTQSPDPKGVTAHSAEQRTWENLTYAELKELNVLYDVRGAVFKYAREMTRMAEFNRMFGEQVTKMDRNGMLYETWQPDQKIRDAIDQLPEEKQAQARVIVDGMLGRLGKKANPQWTEAQSWMMTLQAMATLTFGTLASLPDIMMSALRSREFSGLGQNINEIARLLSKQDRKEMYDLAYTVGSVSSDLIHESIISGYGSEWMTSTPRRISEAYFKIIGLEHWTRMTRVVATSFAKDFLIKHATQPNARSERYLTELEIDAPTIQAWRNNDQNFDSPEGRRVKEAMLSFVDEAVLRPNAAERPTYGSDPRFMIFFQLKGFFYSFGQKVVGGLYREMQSRRAAGESIPAATAPMLLAGIALMPLAAVALSIREGIKYEEGEAPTDEMNVPEYMFEVMTRAGFLGPLEIPRAMFQAEQYGQPFWAAPLGPSVGTGLDLINSKGFSGLEGLLPAYNTGIYN